MKRDNAAGGMFFSMMLAYVVIFISLFYSYYIYYQSSMIALEENVDNAMNEANLSAMTLDLDAFSYDYDEVTNEFLVNPYLISSQDAFNVYESTICTNMNIDKDNNGAYVPKANTRWASFLTSINILDVVVLDVVYSDTGILQVSARDINGWRELVLNQTTGLYELGGQSAVPSYCDAGAFISPDGIIVDSPSVYSRIQLNIDSNVLGHHAYVRHNTTSIVTIE